MQQSALRKVLVVCAALVVAGGFSNDAFARGGDHGGHGGGGGHSSAHMGAGVSAGVHFGGADGGNLSGHFGDGLGHFGGRGGHPRGGTQPSTAVTGSRAIIPFFRPEDPASDCRLNERALIGGQWVWERSQIC